MEYLDHLKNVYQSKKALEDQIQALCNGFVQQFPDFVLEVDIDDVGLTYPDGESVQVFACKSELKLKDKTIRE